VLKLRLHKLRPLALAIAATFNLATGAQAACVPLTALGNAYSENFDSLATTGTANTLAISGWAMLETGSNANTTYASGTGSSTTGNTYSFGASGSTDRAFGGLQSGSLIPTIGACFVNNTGSTITSLGVNYTGEEWRLGTAARTDSLNFQFSTSATALNNGAWTGVSALDFATPTITTVGAKDGNAAVNRTAKSSTIPALNIANGATFWIRWTDTNATSADDGLAVDDFSLTPSGDVSSACSAVDTPIGQIQGSGATAALTGTRTVEGVVVGDYEGASPALAGFYLQNTAATADGDPNTSDAIFVYNAGGNAVSLGQVVQVTGTVAENQGQTEIDVPTVVSCGLTGTVTPSAVTLPVPAAVDGVDYLERFEGMLINFAQTLYVSEHFQLGRFGQVVMSANDRLPQPTHIATPGANALAQQAANDLNRIIVDDERQNQNPDPIRFGRGGANLTASNTLRGGDTVTNLVGVMTYTWSGNAASGNAFRLRPINALGGGAPNFVAANPRATVPASAGGVLKVASANLLNFFNTFTNCTLGVGGAASTANCRGAENQTEFDRQWPKTVENLVGTGAAVIIVNEMENDGYGTSSAIQFLVNKMNLKAGAGTYAFVNPDTHNGTNSLGNDAIKVAMIYQPGVVTKVGITAVLNTGALGQYYTSSGTTSRNRPAVAQAFQENTTGSRFIVVGNHLKSKGSACDDNTGLVTSTYSTTSVVADADAGDGQGNCNHTRTAAAEELVAWLALDPTGTGDSDILIMGDLNAYAKEDPITAIKNAGYVNLIESQIGVNGYSYVFNGQWGYLDHALASSTLVSQVQDVLEWHINADEPSVLDYNTNFKSTGQLSSLYSPDAYRTSDHDPIVIGVTLVGP
jgi:predicted extracellular nuclease